MYSTPCSVRMVIEYLCWNVNAAVITNDHPFDIHLISLTLLAYELRNMLLLNITLQHDRNIHQVV